MPNHYILHKLNVHPKYHHVKKHLSHFMKIRPKTGSSLFSSHPSREEITATMQGEGFRHRKKLHPLKFKI
jgi:hypothetical protein